MQEIVWFDLKDNLRDLRLIDIVGYSVLFDMLIVDAIDSAIEKLVHWNRQTHLFGHSELTDLIKKGRSRGLLKIKTHLI